MEENNKEELPENQGNEQKPEKEAPEESFAPRIDLSSLKDKTGRVMEESSKVLVDMKGHTRIILIAMICEGHVLLEGVPGIAKTLMAKTMAKLIEAEFARLQFTPDLMPSDVTGTYVFNPKIVEFELKKGPIFTNVVLVDEINRAPAKTQSALFEVMEEKQVTIEGKTNIMPFPFLVLATQNPIEFEGTYRLPEAQIDRFMFKILIDYPSEASEREVLKIKNENPGHTDISGIKPVISKDDLRKFRSMMYEVHVEDYLLDYINSIVRSTRHNSQIFLGASPRAAISLLFASKAYAALEGRDFVKPEDIHEMALPALRHRIILTSEIEMEGRTEDEVIRGIMANIEIPR